MTATTGRNGRIEVATSSLAGAMGRFAAAAAATGVSVSEFVGGLESVRRAIGGEGQADRLDRLTESLKEEPTAEKPANRIDPPTLSQRAYDLRGID